MHVNDLGEGVVCVLHAAAAQNNRVIVAEHVNRDGFSAPQVCIGNHRHEIGRRVTRTEVSVIASNNML